ncbi:SDR family NAD(P)-dependent oxidoreductase [Neisseria sp.]|uniref:SDR family NAD(P)-dependent oxidoreductase n=1 Tax=Neisseria sp. TaxID=192066 RepID=UPI0035A05852
MNRFENKTILITGASSGIGLAGAKRLIREGANVIITGRTPSRLDAAAKDLGEKATAILDDVADGKTLDRLMPVVEKAGGLDGV